MARLGRLTASLCAFAALLTLTRSIWIGTVLGFVLTCVTYRPLRRALPALMVVGVAATVTALVFVPGLRASTVERSASSLPVYDRQNTDVAALRLLRDFPLTGVGWVRFPQVSPDTVRQADDYPLTKVSLEVHNAFLARGAELGWPGLLLFAGVFVAGPVRIASRRASDSEGALWTIVLVGGGACWFVAASLSPLAQALPNQLLWLVAGVAAAVKVGSRSEATTQPAISPRLVTDRTV